MSKVPILCRVQARYPFNSNDPSSLSFQQGDFIEVLTKLDSGWWDGWCNGVRGWFPSNYVQIIDDYEQEDNMAEHSNVDPRLHREENLTRHASTSDESDIVTPRTKNGVPLRTNNDYRLSLPYQGLDPPVLSKPSMAQVKSKPMLPPNWSLQMTEDGSECYYYNHVTGEMRSTHPEDSSDAENDDNASYGVNGSIDDEEEEDYDFKSVDSRPWEERTPDDIPEKIPSPWMKRTNSQGRICYFNPITNQMVVDLSEIDPSTGKIKTDEQWRPPLPDDPPTTSIPPKPLPRSPSRQTSVRRTSVIDNNEPLTWNKLSAHIALAIHNLNTAAKNGQRTLFIPNAAAIVNAIRMMLITSGTIDKESVYIKGNSVLRAHHRAMMASMSKLVLSSQLSADSTSENIGKMLSDSNELLLAVRNFVTTCQDIPVAVQHMDPVLTDKTPRKAGESSTTDTPRTKYTLQSDLADNLETYGASMHESLEAMLQSIRRDVSSEESRFSLAALVFTQFRNLANQTAQFIGDVEDIDYNGVDESPNVLELRRSRQQLSDGLGTLFCWMQSMTDEKMALENVVSEMESAATVVSKSIRSICSCVEQLVRERGKSTPTTPTSNQAPSSPSPVTTTTNLADSIIHEEEESLEKEESPVVENISETTSSPIEPVESKPTPEAINTPGSPTVESVSPPASVTSGLSATESTRSPTTATGSQSKATSRKLQKFFGDDAPAAVAAASKPSVNERIPYLDYDYDPNEIVFNMEGVKGGTLPALVERLTLHDYLDMNFINTFLLTYRSFCSSMELLNLLKARYNLKVPEDLTEEEEEIWTQKKLKLVRLRVFNVLKNWLELYYNEDDHIILEPLEEFTATSIRSSSSFSADQLEKLIRMRKEDQSQGGLKKMVLTLPDPPEPILPRNRKKLRLMDIDTLEMARQLTIMDFNLYSSIRPVECLDKAWSRDSGDENTHVAVNIRASIAYCNEVTSWVSDEILSQSDIKKRSNVIKHWVQVAEKCRLLNNFNTCMAILSAFDNSSVGRLKRTWEMVGARTNQILSQIRKLMGANRNFTEYRAIIHSINPPCIPFLGIYLQDLTFIEDGNPNYLKKSKELINFAKRAKTAEVIREIQQYQSSLYRLKPVEELQAFIQANLQSTRNEEQLYEESLKLEPREREDEKITRLLQESGFL
ncbi:ras GEF [Lichtheimia hyalospora FSU 10163]|nr:ras GEF [Lichtheimia hyalospora FSU 10163]